MSRKCRSFSLFLFGFDSFFSSCAVAVVVVVVRMGAIYVRYVWGILDTVVFDGLLLFLPSSMLLAVLDFVASRRESGIILTG